MDFNQLEQELKAEGVAQIGYAAVEADLPPRYKAFPRAMVLVWRLCDGVLDEVLDGGPTFSYFQHYRAVNATLDRLTLRIATLLEREGYRAMPVAASQSVHDNGAYAGIFPHKTAAVRAGLGWIGKNALFVSPEWGPRVRLATVLTDHPLVPERVYRAESISHCGSCRRCVDSCPAHALTGREFEAGMCREDVLAPDQCSAHMKQAYQQIGRGAVCGICAAVCPFGRK